MLNFLETLAEKGILGLVAAIAILFAWYQTRRIERLTTEVFKATKDYAFSLAEIFKLNTGEQANDRPKTNPGVASFGSLREPNPFDEPGEASPKGEGGQKAD